jgi:hypothetical protein
MQTVLCQKIGEILKKNQSIKIDKMGPWIRFISNLVKLHYPIKTMC